MNLDMIRTRTRLPGYVCRFGSLFIDEPALRGFSVVERIAASLVGDDSEVIDLVQCAILRMGDPQATWVGYFKITTPEALKTVLEATSLHLEFKDREPMEIEVVRAERDIESGELTIRFVSRARPVAGA